MARVGRSASLDELIQSAVAPVVVRLSHLTARHIAELAAKQLEAELERKSGSGTHAAPRRRSRKAEMTKWIADKRARRVPKFVIEATGLDTKKKIVAKYGENARFANGGLLPPVADKASGETPSAVKAKTPIVRKKGKAAA